MPSGCWEWRGSRDQRSGKGYGVAYDPVTHRMAPAHRVAWQLMNGPIPDGMGVLHHCDNPPCVNPGHLFIGTAADNTRDMMAKGRGWQPVLRGADHPRAIPVSVVEAIRQRYREGGISQIVLSRQHGINLETVNRIVRGHHWATDGIPVERPHLFALAGAPR